MVGRKYWNDVSSRSKHLILWALLTLALCLWIAYDFHFSLGYSLKNKTTMVFSIQTGESPRVIGAELKHKGLIVEPLWFTVYAYLHQPSNGLVAGEYDIPPGTSVRGLVDMFVHGRIRLTPVTIIEGWTFAQMKGALDHHPSLIHQTLGKSDEEIMTMLGLAGQKPEGRFFPDTYFVGQHTTDIQILKNALNKMQRVLENEWQNRSTELPFKEAYEALVLASIVEKETGRAQERSKIAGVFLRRLETGMRLQTDPSVIYGMGPLYSGDLHKDDLLRDTPWNTYTRNGLPITPIALPGKESIHAVMHPEKGDALYFVGKGDGTHEFSSNLQDHNKAVNQYQRHVQ